MPDLLESPVTTPGYEDALAMVREIDEPNLKLCLDAPLFYERQSDAYVREAVRECGALIAHTHYGAWNFHETPDGRIVQGPAPSFGGPINYEAFVPALHEIAYRAPYMHDGSRATLFDALLSHGGGDTLSDEERDDLGAYLRSL